MTEQWVDAGGCFAVPVSPTATALVCMPSTFFVRAMRKCPTCEKRRRMVGADQFWYGTKWTCLGCGDAWDDGELCPRPFKRAWRKAAMAKAEKDWKRAGSRDEHRAWVQAQIDSYRVDDADE